MGFIKKTWIYLLTFILGFSTLPYIMMAWRGNEMFVHVIALIPFCLIISAVYGLRNGFSFAFSVVVGASFFISMLTFYSFVAWEYTWIYTAISFIGVVGGHLLNRLFKRWR